MENKIVIYKTSKGTEISVKLENNTVWLDAHTALKNRRTRGGLSHAP